VLLLRRLRLQVGVKERVKHEKDEISGMRPGFIEEKEVRGIKCRCRNRVVGNGDGEKRQ
jgi:hypothetical protein